MPKHVSLSQGQDSIATPSVKAAHVPSIHSSTLFSQYRGPHIYNETEEARKEREEAERKKKEDDDKRSNFDKVRERAEREEAARKEAEAKLAALEQEKRDREAADRKAAEAKLEEEKQFETLAKQREAEAKQKTEEAATERARADAAEAKVKAFEDAQEAELTGLLETIPEEKRPPLDPTDAVSKRLQQVKYAKSLIDEKTPPKPPVGGQPPKGAKADAQTRLSELQAKANPTADEVFEMMELAGEKD